jgi:hypothetical protein
MQFGRFSSDVLLLSGKMFTVQIDAYWLERLELPIFFGYSTIPAMFSAAMLSMGRSR